MSTRGSHTNHINTFDIVFFLPYFTLFLKKTIEIIFRQRHMSYLIFVFSADYHFLCSIMIFSFPLLLIVTTMLIYLVADSFVIECRIIAMSVSTILG